MSAEDIRKSIILLENANNQHENLEEAAPMGFLKTLTTSAAALFSTAAEGDLEIGQAANKWYGTYLKYLRKIGKDPDASTIGDLFTFMVENGLKPQAVFDAVTKGMGDARVSIRNMQDLKALWNTAITTDAKGKISKTLLYAMQNQVNLRAEDRDPEDLMKQAQTGAQIAAQAASGAGATAAPSATPKIDTGDPVLDKHLSDMMASKGINAVIKLLKDAESALTKTTP